MSLMRLERLMLKIGLKKPTIYSMMKRGLLPRPIKIGRASLWVESEIDEFVEAKINAKNKLLIGDYK